jgi:hypothetical protein
LSVVSCQLSVASRQSSVVRCGELRAIFPLTPETWQLNLLFCALLTGHFTLRSIVTRMPPSVMQHSKMRLWGVHFRLFGIPKWNSWLA